MTVEETVETKFAAYGSSVRPAMLALRKLVRHVAKSSALVGEIEETLKWGQPSFLPKRARVGTTVRMDVVSETPTKVALYFHCQTTLVDSFRSLYGDVLTLEGNRAIVLDADAALPEVELRHCIEMALTYHATKRAKAS